MTDDKDDVREMKIRVNSDDKEAIEKLQQQKFDDSVALGWVVRYACQKVSAADAYHDETDDESDDSGVTF